MTETKTPPGEDEIEVTLFGPGYGESIVLHVGGGVWVVVDSCCGVGKRPAALEYLEKLGIDAADRVELVVATHWHDDHIRGMAQLVEICDNAEFCCASALGDEEFYNIMRAYNREASITRRSGLREIYDVFSYLDTRKKTPHWAIRNRRLFHSDSCEIWSLSPSDKAQLRFLRAMGCWSPKTGQPKGRVASLSPNEAAVALWVEIGDIAILLGSDLEKPGWVEIVMDKARPTGKASAFKVPHHGSANADEPAVWREMLEPEPRAVLTPWRRGRSALPTRDDAARIVERTPNAWTAAAAGRRSLSPEGRDGAVRRTVGEAGATIRPFAPSPGRVRLRRKPGADWTVELFGSARRLEDMAA